ncbi:MAG: hypothetical protein WD317_03955, partial [Balneolaceae bacterium]
MESMNEVMNIEWLRKQKPIRNVWHAGRFRRDKSVKHFFPLIVLVFVCNLVFIVGLLAADDVRAQQVDILIKGGHVIDPANGIDGPSDVAIADGKILRVDREISADNAERVVDASGLYVTPGLIDMHAHVFHGTQDVGFGGFEINNSYGSIPPDGFTFRSGVTTIVDAGSSGWRDFPDFREQTVENSRTRVLAFLSIAGSGMLGTVHAQRVEDMDPVATAFVINQNRDVLVGIKKHHYRGGDFTPVERAVQAGEIADVPVMVDFG